MPSLGETLKAARISMGLSLRDVEARTGISNGYLSQLESNSVKQPSPHHLHSLSTLYGLSYAELMQLVGYHVPTNAKRGRGTLAGLAFAGAEDLTEDEREQVKQYIELIRRARR
jgi:transcriptional regulator with XRE-family HTH domain